MSIHMLDTYILQERKVFGNFEIKGYGLRKRSKNSQNVFIQILFVPCSYEYTIPRWIK